MTTLKTLKSIAEADDISKELKRKGDLHISNVKRFFGKWVEKSDPLRDAVKAVVFGRMNAA
jgi:pullulanase/glycogen debranching enzyme